MAVEEEYHPEFFKAPTLAEQPGIEDAQFRATHEREEHISLCVCVQAVDEGMPKRFEVHAVSGEPVPANAPPPVVAVYIVLQTPIYIALKSMQYKNRTLY